MCMSILSQVKLIPEAEIICKDCQIQLFSAQYVKEHYFKPVLQGIYLKWNVNGT